MLTALWRHTAGRWYKNSVMRFTVMAPPSMTYSLAPRFAGAFPARGALAADWKVWRRFNVILHAERQGNQMALPPFLRGVKEPICTAPADRENSRDFTALKSSFLFCVTGIPLFRPCFFAASSPAAKTRPDAEQAFLQKETRREGRGELPRIKSRRGSRAEGAAAAAAPTNALAMHWQG